VIGSMVYILERKNNKTRDMCCVYRDSDLMLDACTPRLLYTLLGLVRRTGAEAL
jgi:hypothetical protein